MRKISLLVGLVFVLLLVGLVSASFEIGMLTLDNETIVGIDFFPTYGPRGTLAGDINLSLDEQTTDSVLSASFSGSEEQSISLKDFLDRQTVEVDYTCSTASCETDYVTSNAETSKDFSSSGMVGIRITGEEVISLSDFTLSVESAALQTCSQPLRIDMLNDGSYEWVAYESTGTFDCGGQRDGCYVAADKESDATISTNKYCNKIVIPATPEVEIGANLDGTETNVAFEMEIFNDNYSSMTCDLDVSASSDASCVVDMRIASEEEFDVCISAKTAEDANKYTIGLENVDPCGYVGSEEHDFAIFAKSGRYAAVGSFTLSTTNLEAMDPPLGDETNIESYIMNHISDNYNDDCSNGCIIPIAIDTSSQVILSDFSMAYELGSGLSQTASNLYDLSEGAALLSIGYTVLDISKAGFRVPEPHADYDVNMAIDATPLEIVDGVITVLEAPVVDTVYPQRAPVGLDVVFRIFTSGEAADMYTFDFGDNSTPVIISENKLVHSYATTGTYTLTASVENELGKDSRTFQIDVVSPAEYMDELFQENQDGIEAVRAEIATYASWLKSYFDVALDLNNKEVGLNTLKTQYDGSEGATTDYVDIIDSIEELWIPTDIELVDGSTLDFLIDKNQISITDLQTLGAGTPKGTEADNINAIVGWSQKNILIEVTEQEYYTYHDSAKQVEATKFMIKVVPNIPLDQVYLVVNGEPANLAFADSSLNPQPIGDSTGVLLGSMSSARDIELILPGKVDTLELPIYLAPAFSQLSVVSEIDVCNNNGVCEEGRGEDSSNCRADCKPWGWVWFWIFLVLLIAFIVYIILQEWYKKKYESHLFPNKNDLYNLINFMDNAVKQGLKREQLFDKLKEKGWTHEQMVYAWRKYKGLRTGLWEIPVLKPFEKKKTKQEIEKRRMHGQTGKEAPIPRAKPGVKKTEVYKKIHEVKHPTHTKKTTVTKKTSTTVLKPSKKLVPQKHNINKGKSSFTFKK